jgi:AMP nucleosidase
MKKTTAQSFDASAYPGIKDHFYKQDHVHDMVFFESADKILLCLQEIYQQQTQQWRNTLFSPADPGPRCYPYLGVYVAKCDHTLIQSHGLFSQPGFYGATITQPVLYARYLHQQISLLLESHQIIVGVGISSQPIPRDFLPHTSINTETGDHGDVLHMGFHDYANPLQHIDDSIINGQNSWDPLATKPLSLFSAERTDYSLARLNHYCGTSAEHFQNFVLLTNYNKYVESFFAYACDPRRHDEGYTSWAGPSNHWSPLQALTSQEPSNACQNFQMPAYHLQRPDRQGITLINIGVGPSNMKTITDHLAVLRAHCWVMLGHCGGLHHTQRLGDFVLANGYVREDRVLDEELPLHIPIPPMPEVQKALCQAGKEFFPDGAVFRRSMRSGTVLTTANRNWELRVKTFSPLIHMSRSIAIDMESATLATNAFRFSIPYGALLCVSDRPLHGDLKMAESAQNFYKERIHQHLMMGIHGMEILRNCCPLEVHSRKLRGLYATPFR